MPWVNMHLQRQGDPGSCIKSPWADRSQWPADSPWVPTPPQQSRDGYPGCETRASFSLCMALPSKGWGNATLPELFFYSSARRITLIFAAYSPCAALGRNIRRSLIWPLLKVQPHQSEKLLAWGFSSVQRTIKDFGQPLPILCYPQSDFFFFSSSLKLSFQLVPVTTEPPTMNHCAEPASSPHRYRGCCQSPEVFPSPG